MTLIRLGAVEYLNARPLVFGLQGSSRFALRFDVPSRCAELLHGHQIDVGLIPSIEYLRGPRSYAIVPGPAVTSRGPVASVALYTRIEPRDIRTIAMDTSSRTSIALALVLARRALRISPKMTVMPPDLGAMLEKADAALVIGDNALFLDHEAARVQKVDLGDLWTRTTGLPFVYAFWAGWPHVIAPSDAAALQRARDEGVAHVADIARDHCRGNRERQDVAGSYLRDNIQYWLGAEELEGLRTFYQYATEAGLASYEGTMNFYHADSSGTR